MLEISSFSWPDELDTRWIDAALRSVDTLLGDPLHGILSVVVVSPDEIARLNSQYRHVDGPTDILTFSFLGRNDEGKISSYSDQDVVGEIYLCLPKIQLYAAEWGVTYEAQLQMIMIHGLAHLLGYDHEDAEDERDMQDFEARLMQEIRRIYWGIVT